MKKVKRKLTIALSVLTLLVCCVASLVACNVESQESGTVLVTVSFDANDGSSLVEKTMTVDEIRAYTPGARVGYDFAGWTFDKEGNVKVGSLIANGSTLYAQWTAKVYAVYFMLNKATLVEKQFLTYGSTITPPSQDKVEALLAKGVEFIGWQGYSSTDVVTEERYIYATLSDVVYTVKFQDGDTVVTESTGTLGESIFSPQTAPTKAGYTFLCWETSDGTPYESGTTFNGNATYYARYTLNAPATPKITGESNITYGETATLTASIDNAVNGIDYLYSWFIGDNKIGDEQSVTLPNLSASEVGYTVRCEAVASDGVATSNASSETHKIKVGKATLTATIGDLNLTYGDGLPEITVNYVGFVNNDTSSVVDETAIDFTTVYTSSSAVGTYYVTASGMTADNYDFVGTVGADKAITATIYVAKRTVSALSTLTNSTTYNGEKFNAVFGNSDFSGILDGHTLSLSATTKSSSAGDYDTDTLNTTLAIVDGNGSDVSGNYDVTYSVVLTVNKANINYVAPGKAIFTYNGDYQTPVAFDNDFVGVTYSSTPDGAYTVNVPSFKNAGDYTVYYKIIRENYNDVADSFDVAIAKANLSINVSEQETVYGDSFTLNANGYTVDGAFTAQDKNSLNISLSCDYTVGNSVGNYTITANYTVNDNYNISANNGTLSVAKRNIDITLDDDNIVYGNTFAPSTTYVKSASNLYGGDEIADVISVKTDYTLGANVGNYGISCELKSDNYLLSSVTNGTLSVSKRPVTVLVGDKSLTYGDLAPANYGYTVDGTYNNETLTISVTCEYAQKDGVKTYAIVGTLVDDEVSANYDVTIEGGTLTVSALAITVTLDDIHVTYGDSLDYSAVTFTADKDWVDGAPSASKITYNCTYSQGDYTGTQITISNIGDSNYSFTFNPANVVIDKRNVTLSYTNANVAYNGSAFAFEVANCTVNGAYGNDVVGGTITTSSANNGTYSSADDFIFSVVVKNSEDIDVTACYNITYDINVVIKTIEIAHDITNTSLTYNGNYQSANLVLAEGSTATATYTFDGETTTTMPTFKNVGDYVVSYTLSQEGKTPYSGNFTVTVKPYAFSLVVGQDLIDINDCAFGVRYGDEFAIDNTLQNFYFLPNNEAVATNLGFSSYEELLTALNVVISCNYEVGWEVGTYDVDVSYVQSPNYTVTLYNQNKFCVNPKEIQVYGGNYSTVYGENAIPYTSGFSTSLYAGESSTIITDEYASAAAQYITITPKDYVVGEFGKTYETIAACSNKNYIIRANYVVMTVTARPVTVKANDATFTYGNTISVEYTVVSGSVVSGDTLNITIPQPSSNNVGTHTVTPIDAGNQKYTVTAKPGVITIKKASLTVALSGTQSITYGDDMPTYSASYSGFKFTDDSSVLNGTLVVACDYNTEKKAGTFTVAASGLSADNYDITYSTLSLVVGKAQLSIQANDTSAIVYGSDIPAFTYTATGFVAGDTDSVLVGHISFNTDYYKGANVGTYSYNVVCSALDNYNVTIGEAKTLTVNKATYTTAQLDAAVAKLNLNGTYNVSQTLSAFSLGNTGFNWVNPNAVPTCDNTAGYLTTYCADTTNYEVANVYVGIALAKANPNLTAVGSNFGADWTGSAIDYASIISVTDGNTDANKASYGISVLSPSTTNVIDGGIYKIRYTLPTTTNYLAGTLDVTFKVYSVDYNGTHYTVEDALSSATINNGGTLTMFGNAFLSNDVTLNSGITLILPISASFTTTAGSVSTSVDYNTNKVQYHAYTKFAATYELDVPENVTMTLNGGNVLIAGILGNAGTGLSGQTSGEYSQINNNGQIIVNSGILDVRGYVMTDGTGSITMNGGTLYMPYAVRDFKGGTYSSTAWNYLNLLASNKVAPYSEYETLNVQCKTTYYSSATMKGYCDLYASSSHNATTVDMISSNGIIQISSGGYVIKTFDKATTKSTLTLVGNITLGSMSLKISTSIVSMTVKMSDTFFPIPWTYDVNIGDGTTATTLNIANDIKILPGCTVTVKNNATLNATAGSLIVYSNWTDTNTIRKYPTSYGTEGKLVVDGGTINAYKFGGIIYATANGGTVKVSKAVSATAYEHNNEDRYTVSETARFEDGTTITKGTTYTYNGSTWA